MRSCWVAEDFGGSDEDEGGGSVPEEECGGKSLELELGYGSHKIEDEERGGGGIEEDSGPADELAGGFSEDCETSEDDEIAATSEEPLRSGKVMPEEESPTIS